MAKKISNTYILKDGVIRCFVSSGRSFIFDVCDEILVKSRLWNVNKYGYTQCFNGGKREYLHRLLLGATDTEIVDHINGDTRDYRRLNLRKCSKQQNSANQSIRDCNTSGYKGVSYVVDRGKYQAYITHNRKRYALGRFYTAKDAAVAYNKAAVYYFGEFARLNNFDQEE